MLRSSLFLAIISWFLYSCGGAENNKQVESTQTIASTATMYYGGDIITMEGDSAQYAEALVVKDGKNTVYRQQGRSHEAGR